MLPGGELYDYLEGRFPHPANTFTKIIEIVEDEEKRRINKLIGERRTRIGARIGQVTNEVKREVFKASNLESLYQNVIDWSQDDDLRRLYEERLLQRAYDTLAVLLPTDKPAKRPQVQKLSEGMVILKHPFPPAWKVVLEWQDVEEIAAFQPSQLTEYIDIFPDDGLTKILQGYLGGDASPFGLLEKTSRLDPAADSEEALSAEDRLIVMTEGLEQSSKAFLSQRIMGEYLLHLQEYSNAVDCAEKALNLLQVESDISGLELQNSFDGVKLILATALIHHQSPRNHPKAHDLFSEVLQRKPKNTSALIGTGLILEEEQDYQGAYNFLSQAVVHSPDIKVRSEAAWCRALTGDYEDGLSELRKCLDELDSSQSLDKNVKAEVHYRIGQCIWNLGTSKAERKDRNGAYAQFLASLQSNLSFAPAYTSLGIYYADYTKDKGRARKCFQKAFELSPSEIDAAERLARVFADWGDLDLVEVVSQRVIDSGKVRPPPGSKRKGFSWPFAALGICQLNNQDYTHSVVSFQAALRISPEDYNSWVGLGESYHNSGRYIAATKAFEQAQKLQEQVGQTEHSWFPEYMLANVKRELGIFEEAGEGYEKVLLDRPNEYGIAIALLQTHAENAWACIQGGLFGRSKDSCVKAIDVAGDLVRMESSTFNLWKTIGDVCAMFLWMQSYTDAFPVEKVKAMLEDGSEADMYISVTDIDDIGPQALSSLLSHNTSLAPVYSAILAQKRAISCCSKEIHGQAVAWFNLGWTEYQASFHVDTATGNKNQYLKAAVRCFKRAIELEAGNADFWNALGIVTTQLNPKVAQHAFVRSLHLNDRSAASWTNLGTLYLLQNDVQLANEAFTRGQSTDPDYAHAWLGQGILALMMGEITEAQRLFEQAFEISDAASLISKKLYSLSSFDQVLATDQPHPIAELLRPLFALHQLKSQTTADVVFQHLSALISERIGDHIEPVTTLTTICSRLEAEYEESESPDSLARFAHAMADLGRAQLAANDFENAITSAETALDLSADENSSLPTRVKLRLSAHLTSGLAYSAMEGMDAAISMFRTALEESDGNPDIVCVLGQVLWAKGGEEERGVVREQLFDCIEKHPEHASSICLLAVIAILDDDAETLEAVEFELHNLRTRETLSEEQKLKIAHLLSAVAKFKGSSKSLENEESLKEAEVSEAASTIMLSPFTTHGWRQLADASGAETVIPGEMALLTVKGAVPPKGDLDAEALAEAFACTDITADAQRAVMVSPWLPAGWTSLVS